MHMRCLCRLLNSESLQAGLFFLRSDRYCWAFLDKLSNTSQNADDPLRPLY